MAMKRYSPEELAEVLRLHKLWLNDEDGGERANLGGAYLDGANLDGANLDGANLRGANLRGAYLDGAGTVAAMAVFSGLYKYQCWAVVATDGTSWVRMGCLFKTVEEWDRIGIRQSNHGEFPDNGAERSEQRVRAFDFTRAEAVRLAAKAQPTVATPVNPPYHEGDRVQISEDGHAAWPWAPEGVGCVLACAGGWTRIDYPDRYLTAPDGFLEPAAKEQVA